MYVLDLLAIAIDEPSSLALVEPRSTVPRTTIPRTT